MGKGLRLNGFSTNLESTYYFGNYPHIYVEVKENAKNEQLCKTETIDAFDFPKLVENLFTGCLDEASVMRDGHTLLNLEYRPFILPTTTSGRLCVEIQPYAEGEYADIACLGVEPLDYIQTGKTTIITESYDEGLIKRIASLMEAVYNAGSLNDKNVRKNALKLFLFQQRSEKLSIWNVGYIPIRDLSKKTVHIYSDKIPDSVAVEYEFFLAYVIFNAFGRIYIGNLPFNYIVNPGEPQHLGEDFDVVKVINVSTFSFGSEDRR
ncbi:MAG: hypothetical protein RXR17_09190 [Sulfolobaceae archaeon]